MVEGYDLTPESSEKIYLAISKFFEETNIGDIVDLLQDKLNLSDDDICERLIDLFNQKGDILTQKIVFNLKEKKISEFAKIDLEKVFKSKVMPLIYKFIKSNQGKINNYVAELLKNKTEQILNNNIANLISEEKVGLLSKKLPKIYRH